MDRPACPQADPEQDVAVHTAAALAPVDQRAVGGSQLPAHLGVTLLAADPLVLDRGIDRRHIHSEVGIQRCALRLHTAHGGTVKGVKTVAAAFSVVSHKASSAILNEP